MTNRKEKHQCIVDHSIHATYDGMLINELSDILKESIKKTFRKYPIISLYVIVI